jgi:hypothetical protein
MFSEINQLFRASVPIFVLSFVCIAAPVTAFAGTVYDGNWSVVIVTRSGVCEPTFRYGVQIDDGTVIDGGGMATVQGRVTRTGAVKVIVRSGNQWANGSGRLSRNSGGGMWRGEGASGICRGTWVAERRG